MTDPVITSMTGRNTMKDKNELNIDQLDTVSGGYIYYNEQKGVYEVISCIGEVFDEFKDRWDAIDYARKLLISDFEVTPYFISVIRGTVPSDPNQEMLTEIIKSMPIPVND